MAHKLYACMGSGNCFKPWQVMKVLGIPFELELVDVLAGAQKKPDYLAINPQGVVPYLITEAGSRLGESNAMAWFLAEGSPLMPDTPAARAEALQWMFFEQSKLEPFISPARFFTTVLPDAREERADDIAAWQMSARAGLAHLDQHLSKHDFIVQSRYTVADIAVFGYVHVMEEGGLPERDFPHVASWIARVQNTDGFVPLAMLGVGPHSAAA
ncbi:MAG: glutathione S-transferase family protein [Pseudomonadota bacterium]